MNNTDQRKDQILMVAIELSKTTIPTRLEVAEAAGVSEGLVSHYFGNMDNLHSAVMQEAVNKSVIEVVVKGLCAGNPIARCASDEVKKSAAQFMMSL